ncbi:PAAR-like domain-containing protein [Chitinimonas lacunae]|uniref:PAAR-like domain-containing protein n=1 Tax=Chitinimonas lacunae TaxID=1963018 RepID=A0ABV8MLD4_9NEIS
METHVYANSREIASKGANGRSLGAFPDPCWSPPSPSAGPIILPYPNTALIRDLAKGSNTVFICGQMVALEDVSYFSRSTGNEPATRMLGQGVATHVITGRAYFRSWSMDVQVEGFCVPRHLDLTTHNHGSQPPNTPPTHYIDTSRPKNPCDEELENIAKKCSTAPPQPGDKKDQERDLLARLSKRHPKLAGAFSKLKNKVDSPVADWIEEHCDGLLIKPGSFDAGQMDALREILDNGPTALGQVARDMLKDAAMEVLGHLSKEAAEKAGKMLARTLSRHAVISAVAAAPAATGVGAAVVPVTELVGNVVGLVIDVVDGIWTAYQIGKEAPALIAKVKEVFGAFDNLGKATSSLFERYGLDPKTATWDDLFKRMKKVTPTEMAADAMSVMAKANPCTRARRCILVRYEDTEQPKAFDGTGCCPGQTGHHLIPDKMMQGVNCPGYEYPKAPNVCVEGVNQSHGTHNEVHKRLDKIVKDNAGADGKVSMDQAIAAATASFFRAFPESGCRPNCIESQLKNYYGSRCPNARLNKETGYSQNEKGVERRRGRKSGSNSSSSSTGS